MKFVDRIEEQYRLRKALEADAAQLIVIYGRRRLGKSTLIKQVLKETDIYFMADNSEQTRQRELLANLLAERKGREAAFCQRESHCSDALFEMSSPGGENGTRHVAGGGGKPVRLLLTASS